MIAIVAFLIWVMKTSVFPPMAVSVLLTAGFVV